MQSCTPSAESFFFDLDGTLVDSLPGISFSVQQALRSVGRDMDGQLEVLIGPPIQDILRRLLGNGAGSQLDRVEAEFRKSYDSEGWKRSYLYPGVQSTLKQLKADGTRLFVFTNKPAQVTKAILNATNVASHFDAVLTRDSRKPPFENKGLMLTHLVEEFGVDRQSSIVIGDSPEDFHAAIAAEIPFCFATYGYGRLHDHQSSACAWQIDCFNDVLSITNEECR
ncbi:MAG TPA: HAD hydrolase-like protein [Terriglobales bacterium]|nr:HAD hydrolase-like protein [Terriglobales bacterium]